MKENEELTGSISEQKPEDDTGGNKLGFKTNESENIDLDKLGLMTFTSIGMAVGVDIIADHIIDNLHILPNLMIDEEYSSVKIASVVFAKYAIVFGTFLGSYIWSYFYFSLNGSDYK